MSTARAAPRRLLLLALAAPLLAGCTVPGTEQAVQAGRCLAAPQAASVPGVALPPVWRTYGDPATGLELALPANWEAVAPDAAGLEAQLAAAGTRSPVVAPALRRWAAVGRGLLGSRPSLVAVSSDSAGLIVSQAARLDHRALCAAVTAVTAVPGLSTGEPVRVTRSTLPAGDAVQVTYGASQVTQGRRRDLSLLDLSVLGSDRTLRVRFQVDRGRAAALRPVLWTIARSIRLGLPAAWDAATRNPVSSCLHPDPLTPAFGSSRSPGCPQPVGAPLAGRDCAAAQLDGHRVVAAGTFEAATGRLTGPAHLVAGPDGCVLDAPAGSGVSFGEAGLVVSDVVVLLDFQLPAGTVAGLTLRQRESDVVRSAVDPPRLLLWEQTGGRPAHSLLSSTRRLTPGVPHRLVLSARGSQVQVWLDGVPAGPVTTAAARPGAAVAYVINGAGDRPATFRSLRVAIYEPAAA